MVYQERRVHRLREQVESMMEANRRCDVMRRRQEAFLGHLIEKYQGDNVPLTADLCRQYCSLFEVRQMISLPFYILWQILGVVFVIQYTTKYTPNLVLKQQTEGVFDREK